MFDVSTTEVVVVVVFAAVVAAAAAVYEDIVVVLILSQGPSLEQEAAARAKEEREMRRVRWMDTVSHGLHLISLARRRLALCLSRVWRVHVPLMSTASMTPRRA